MSAGKAERSHAREPTEASGGRIVGIDFNAAPCG
jgi:hypothetical protein